MSVVIYHNPKCTKSRQTLALLDARGITPKVVDYLKTPPTKAELKRILRLLQIEPRALMRRKEPEYEHAKLDNDPTLTGDEKQLCRALGRRLAGVANQLGAHDRG